MKVHKKLNDSKFCIPLQHLTIFGGACFLFRGASDRQKWQQKWKENKKKRKMKRKESEKKMKKRKNVHTKWKGAERQFFSMQLLKENFGFSLTFLSFSLCCYLFFALLFCIESFHVSVCFDFYNPLYPFLKSSIIFTVHTRIRVFL